MHPFIHYTDNQHPCYCFQSYRYIFKTDAVAFPANALRGMWKKDALLRTENQ